MFLPHTSHAKVLSCRIPLSASGGDAPSEQEDEDVTNLVVGVVFGSAAAALLVLGTWVALKKFHCAGGLTQALF